MGIARGRACTHMLWEGLLPLLRLGLLHRCRRLLRLLLLLLLRARRAPRVSPPLLAGATGWLKAAPATPCACCSCVLRRAAHVGCGCSSLRSSVAAAAAAGFSVCARFLAASSWRDGAASKGLPLLEEAGLEHEAAQLQLITQQ